MEKIKLTADQVLQIIQKIFKRNAETNHEKLGVQYFAFKHRPLSSEEIIAEQIKQAMNSDEPKSINTLMAVDRSYCLLSLGETKRVFAKDVDSLTVTANLEYWIQTSKIQYLEDVIEDCNVELCGKRFGVDFTKPKASRNAIIFFDAPRVTDIQTGSAMGEVAVVDVGVTLLLFPTITNYSDYSVSFKLGETEFASFPLQTASFICTMTQKALPQINKPQSVRSINLSKGVSFVLTCEGHENDFIEHLMEQTFGFGEPDEPQNNAFYEMTLTRKSKSCTHSVIIKEHIVTLNADTGNETHSLSLVEGGELYGST